MNIFNLIGFKNPIVHQGKYLVEKFLYIPIYDLKKNNKNDLTHCCCLT